MCSGAFLLPDARVIILPLCSQPPLSLPPSSAPSPRNKQGGRDMHAQPHEGRGKANPRRLRKRRRRRKRTQTAATKDGLKFLSLSLSHLPRSLGVPKLVAWFPRQSFHWGWGREFGFFTCVNMLHSQLQQRQAEKGEERALKKKKGKMHGAIFYRARAAGQHIRRAAGFR